MSRAGERGPCIVALEPCPAQRGVTCDGRRWSFPACSVRKYIMLSCNFLHRVNPITISKVSVVFGKSLPCAISEYFLSLIHFRIM